MEFTIDKLAKEVAEKALDEITYEGKTLREWVEILVKLQPSEDCISREAVITKIEDEDSLNFMGVFCDHDAAMGFRETIKELPSVTPQQTRWIPVSEKLPEIGQRILVTYNQEDEVKIDITDYTKHGFLLSVVIAWKPLPQPYEAESEVNTDEASN